MTGSSVIADTNVFIEIMKGGEAFARKLALFSSVCVTPVVLTELYFGAYRSANPKKHVEKVDAAVRKTRLLVADAETARRFVQVKLALAAKGKPIPENDIWIAAAALQYEMPVFTNDGHFTEVDELDLLQ